MITGKKRINCNIVSLTIISTMQSIHLKTLTYHEIIKYAQKIIKINRSNPLCKIKH